MRENESAEFLRISAGKRTCTKARRSADVSVVLCRRHELSPMWLLVLRRNIMPGGEELFQRLAFALPVGHRRACPIRASILHSVERSADGYNLTRVFRSAQPGRCKASARAVPHYGLPSLVRGTDTTRAARPLGIYDRRRQPRFATMELEVVSRATQRDHQR